LKKRFFQLILPIIAVVLLSSSSLLKVSALESPDSTTTGGNSTWTLRIDTFDSNGLNNSASLSLDDIFAMPKTTVYADLSCYGQLLESGQWGGVSLGLLLEKAGFTEPTANLEFYASDGYTTTLALSDDTPKDIIVAYELDGSLLPETLRLVIPGANGEAWISMITSISINSPIYPSSPNPDAASIIVNQPTLQQPSTPQPSPTPEPRNQPTPQPTAPPPTNQPAQHQDSSSSNIQNGNVYPIITGAIAAAATVAIGYMFYKRRK
jgi:DMSO/TMAO reductase YedYZ molybdopterin-dependent catalytic subunit